VPAGTRKPILIISGYVVPKDIAHLKAMGANDVLRKPFGLSELGETIKRLLAADVE
jgi:CheY-like chemotaxis protein